MATVLTCVCPVLKLDWVHIYI